MSRMPPKPNALFTFKGTMGHIHCILLEGDTMLVTTSLGFVHTWNLQTYREQSNFKIGSSAVLCLVKSTIEYITLEKGGSIKFWSKSGPDWSLGRTLETDFYGFAKIEVAGDLLLYGLSNGKLGVEEMTTQRRSVVQYKFNRKQGEVMCLKWKGGHSILVGYEAGVLALWDVSTSLKLSEVDIKDTLMCFDYCQSSGEGVVGGSGSVFHKFSITEDQLSLSASSELTNPGVSSAAVRSDGKLCVLGCWDGRIRYFTMKTLKLLAVLESNRTQIETVIFCGGNQKNVPTGAVLAGGTDGRVTLWDLYTT